MLKKRFMFEINEDEVDAYNAMVQARGGITNLIRELIAEYRQQKDLPTETIPCVIAPPIQFSGTLRLEVGKDYITHTQRHVEIYSKHPTLDIYNGIFKISGKPCTFNSIGNQLCGSQCIVREYTPPKRFEKTFYDNDLIDSHGELDCIFNTNSVELTNNNKETIRLYKITIEEVVL